MLKAIVQVHTNQEQGEQGGRLMLFLAQGVEQEEPLRYVEIVADVQADEILARFPTDRAGKAGRYFELQLREIDPPAQPEEAEAAEGGET